MQTMLTLIRCHILWYLIWVYAVNQCPFYGMVDLFGFIISYHIISQSDLWLTCRYRGNIHISGPPTRYLACFMHGKPHTRPPGTPTTRADSREPPPSAIPPCQPPPCHFGPPRPTLSINLYVKGCPDCTTGVLHVHTIEVFSPSEWGLEWGLVNWLWFWEVHFFISFS